MGMKLSEIEAGNKIKLLISSGSNHMEMEAIVLKHLQENIALLNLCYESDRTLNFNNVKIEVEYTMEDGTPYIWRTAQVTSFQTKYVLQVKNDGVRYNRRDCFRVGVSTSGKIKILGKGEKTIMIRDISLSGFSITDRKMDLNLNIGNEASVHFEDLGHIINLTGVVVRIEKHEDMVIYGFEIKNLCKDLSSYVNTKQRVKRG